MSGSLAGSFQMSVYQYSLTFQQTAVFMDTTRTWHFTHVTTMPIITAFYSWVMCQEKAGRHCSNLINIFQKLEASQCFLQFKPNQNEVKTSNAYLYLHIMTNLTTQ